MGTFVKPTLEQFDELLKSENGWTKNISGKEFVYDYEMTRFPNIIIKVLTSIKTENNAARKVGQDAIRVFVIRKVGKGFKGYAKQVRVNRTINWRDNVKKAFMRQRAGILARELPSRG
jgi:hypothetical protein